MTRANVAADPTPDRARRRRRLAIAALAAVTVMGVAACSAGGSADTMSSPRQAAGSVQDDAAGAEAEGARDEALTDGAAALESTTDVAGFSAAAGTADTDPLLVDRKVISTGNVVLRADDVAEARLAVLGVVDRFAGEVSEEETATDDDGEVRRSRMVLRVPTADFDDAVEGLAGVAELVSAQTGSEDVTTKVLDVGIRVRVQRRSIRRIELLLDRAQSIRDIVAIEAQLTRRQAALASLEKQQDYLAGQTSMATITVSLQRTVEAQVEEETDGSGFLAGLAAGWRGLVSLAVGAATVAGAVLPFAVVALLLGLPAWPLLRRLRRRPAGVS